MTRVPLSDEADPFDDFGSDLAPTSDYVFDRPYKREGVEHERLSNAALLVVTSKSGHVSFVDMAAHGRKLARLARAKSRKAVSAS